MGLTHLLSVFLPFEYRPRTRSQHPVSSVASSLALIKTLPDEWYQTTTSIDVPSPQGVNSTFQPVTANMLVPNPRVYALSDSVPFHLQLSGRVDSLRALVAPDTFSEQTSSGEEPSSRCSTTSANSRQRHCIKRLQGEVGTSIRVFLLRQVRLELKGKIRVQNLIIGEAQLDAVPPVMTDRPGVLSGSSEEYLSWTGRLQCGEGLDRTRFEHPWHVGSTITSGGFHAGEILKVNDFIAFSVGDSTPPWKDIQMSIGVKMVTESWDDSSEANDLYSF